jgi:hypothetical protein
VRYFVGFLVCTALAHAATNSIIWEKGDQIVQLAEQDDDSTGANNHPIKTTPNEIAAMLEMLRLRYADEESDVAPAPVFTKEEIDNLGNAIATGLGRATPSQDVVFHVIGARRLSPGAFAKRNRVTAGRVFFRDGNLNIIFGQVQTPYRKKNVYGQTDEDFYPRNYGSRTEAAKYDVVLMTDTATHLRQTDAGVRDDWIVIEPAAVATAATSPAASQPDAKPEPARPPASSAVPVVVVEAATSPSSPAPNNSVDKPLEQAGGPSTESAGLTADVEARLEALKRLRDRELISEEAYQAKMKEILQDL